MSSAEVHRAREQYSSSHYSPAQDGSDVPAMSQSSRRPSRSHNGNGSPISPQHYYSPSASNDTPRNQPLPPSTHASPSTNSIANSPSTNRQRSGDNFGPPIAPPRTSSNSRAHGSSSTPHTPQTDRPSASRSGRRNQEDLIDSDKVNTTPRSRRKVSADNSQKVGLEDQDARIRVLSDGASSSTTPAPGNLSREESTVINRVVVTDPQVDIQREQERLAEARPIAATADATPVTGLGLVGSEGVDDGGRGPRSRQDHSASARRKEVKFGEYMLGQTLGEGEFGKVKLGWKKDGSVQVAIKLIRREQLGSNPSRLPKIYREISILKGLAHPNIVRLHEMVETDRHIGIILEYASGGELFDYILNHRYLKDNAARRLFAQLISGVGYLHKKGIVHRDLKLENLLLDRNRNIIITDFGFANQFNPNDELGEEIEYNLTNKDYIRRMRLDRQDDNGFRRGDLMQTSCGSPCYAAPELVVSDSLYTGRKVDVWSCGVILYAMLAGYLPFDDDPANPDGDNINLLYKYIVTTPLTFPEYVSPHARDLLRRILVPDPRKRADLFEVARHSWLSEYAHVVSHITSSTTNVADIANSTVPADEYQEPPTLARSASVREATKPHQPPATAHGAFSHQEGRLSPEVERQKTSRDAKRRTVQVEYVAPQSQTVRGEAPYAAEPSSSRQTPSRGQEMPIRSKPLPQDPPTSNSRTTTRPTDMPRSTSESIGVFSGAQSSGRPTTGGSMNSRPDVRLPSRGSYSQPSAPTIATTNAQGRLAQPKHDRQYMSQQQPTSIGQPSTQQLPSKFHQTPAQEPSPPSNKGHKRSNTVSGLSERLFGRSGSIFGGSGNRMSQDPSRPKSSKRYPPTSMREPYAGERSRTSIDSRRSSSFGFGRKKSDLSTAEQPVNNRQSRRFSLLPSSFSFKGPANSSKESQAYSQDAPQRPSSRGNQLQSPVQLYENQDKYEDDRSGLNRSNTVTAASQQSSSRYPVRSESYSAGRAYNNETPPAPEMNQYSSQRTAGHIYPEGFNESETKIPATSQRQNKGAGVLQKNNRKFGDAYEYGEELGRHASGSSGAARKVMDFFRKRGKARAGDER